MLDSAFESLGLEDPERHFRDAIARYGLDDITDAIGIFRGKRVVGTLPDGADARYLLGIVRNLAYVHEADAITNALLDARLAVRDRALVFLNERREQIANDTGDVPAQLRSLVDEAMSAERSVDRFFWLGTVAELVSSYERDRRRELFRNVARRIHSHFRVGRHERAAAERVLLRRIWPLA